MDDYISRDMAIARLTKVEVPNRLATMTDAKREITEIPAADVAPVRHGRWIEKGKYTFGIMYDCSLCENRILDNGHSWNYCPNCGAKMDGGGGDAAD